MQLLVVVDVAFANTLDIPFCLTSIFPEDFLPPAACACKPTGAFATAAGAAADSQCMSFCALRFSLACGAREPHSPTAVSVSAKTPPGTSSSGADRLWLRLRRGALERGRRRRQRQRERKGHTFLALRHRFLKVFFACGAHRRHKVHAAYITLSLRFVLASNFLPPAARRNKATTTADVDSGASRSRDHTIFLSPAARGDVLVVSASAETAPGPSPPGAAACGALEHA